MSITVQDLLSIVFRQKRLVAVLFVGMFAFFALMFWMEPNVYDAEMKILVKQNRVDPIVTADSQSPYRMLGNVREQDLISEAELLKSRDILEAAAIECHLPRPKRNGWAFVPVVNAFAAAPAQPRPYDAVTLSRAVQHLNEGIRAIPSPNSNLISVTYKSTNPTLAACVLRATARLYLDKHLAVHRAGGAFEFFKQEADRYKADLATIEDRLAQFGQSEQLVTEGTEKEITVRKLGDYTASLLDTRTAIAATQARIRSLEALARRTAPRETKSVRTSPNAALKELQTQLVSLELKRTDVLSKFNPGYRPLQDLEKQIQELKNTITDVKKVPLVEETTDTNPANDWLRVELAKARSELASLKASAPAREQAVDEYRSMALALDRKDMKRTDLVRMQKVNEEKYLLYLRKQEEARIEQELDRQRILNVAIAQDPAIPILPEPSLMSLKLGLTAFLAALLSIGGALAVDHYDRTFRTSAEVATFLQLPVLGSIPLMGDGKDFRTEATV
jgi:uncharacterized protein involved in exopolysaccharide biosynthesis